MTTYKITSDAGTVTLIRAGSRTEAIELYRKETGASEEFVRAHCVVRRGYGLDK